MLKRFGLHDPQFRRDAVLVLGYALVLNLYYYGGSWMHSNGYLGETAMFAVSVITFLFGSVFAILTILTMWD